MNNSHFYSRTYNLNWQTNVLCASGMTSEAEFSPEIFTWTGPHCGFVLTDQWTVRSPKLFSPYSPKAHNLLAKGEFCEKGNQ